MHLTPERQAAARRLARKPTHSLIVRSRPSGEEQTLEDYEGAVRVIGDALNPRTAEEALKG
jgi:hypothetical protein